MPRLMKFAAASFLAIMVMCSVRALAEADPPSRVARLSYLSGDVSFQPGGVDDWTSATLNRPLTSGDRLWTARDARAELHIGNAALRLNGETSFTLANLGDGNVQIQLAQGTLAVRVRSLYEDESFEIDTPNFTLNLLRAGEYRIEVDNDHDVSWVTVRSGSALANGSGQAVTVHAREQVKFAGGDQKTYEVASAPGTDTFDEWCAARTIREDNAKSARYVSREVIGYEDLDEYGSWRSYGTYGTVWVPASLAPGWAPYRFGHWAWVYPWGWTWIDDARWGFAPFHYGRWVYAPFGWAWVPGPVYVRPVYAPALVAWIGGRNWGVGLSFGGGGYGYGWLPLGPREPFIPWYRGSRHYWSRVNVTNTTVNNTYITNVYNNYNTKVINNCRGDCDNMRNITNIKYANRMAPNGVTVVDRDAFVRSRPVSQVAMKVNSDAIRSAPVLTRLDASPTRASALGGREGAPAFRPPQRALDRPVLTRSTVPRPMSLDAQARSFGVETRSGAAGDAMKPGGARPGSSDALASGRQGRFVPKPGAHEPEGNSQEVNRIRTGNPDIRREGVSDSVAKRTVPRPPERQTAIERPGRSESDAGNSSREMGAAPASKRVVPKPPERQTSPSDIDRPGRERSLSDIARPDRSVPRPDTSSGGRVNRPANEDSVGRSPVAARERVPRPAQESVERPRVRVSEGAVDRPVRAERRVENQSRAARGGGVPQRQVQAQRTTQAPRQAAPTQVGHATAGAQRAQRQH